MPEWLTSVGLDVGTTSTQMIVSRLLVENRAGAFAVPEPEITRREILYRSPVHFTPLLDESHVDGEKLARLVEREYHSAGITPDAVDTGAVIITGETSRKENAASVLASLSHMAGDFVVATAGPDLESILAAKGSGAVDYSRRTGKPVLHMDIGGGTSNLALIENGEIRHTGCLNVGGRLIRFTEEGVVTYVSPVLRSLCPITPGQKLERHQAEAVAQTLTQALEMAAGLCPRDPRLETLLTEEAADRIPPPEEPVVLSFSGGVADCVEKEHPWMAFGDIGPVLGQAIRKSRLCRGAYILGQETIRATVIGAGCHAAQLSGATVYSQNVTFPVKNAPVVRIRETSEIGKAQGRYEEPCFLALKGISSPSYHQVAELAEAISRQAGNAVLVCLEQDMAKALGQALAARLPRDTPILCIDGVRAGDGSFLDVGSPVLGAMPVVVKTLVTEQGNRRCV